MFCGNLLVVSFDQLCVVFFLSQSWVCWSSGPTEAFPATSNAIAIAKTSRIICEKRRLFLIIFASNVHNVNVPMGKTHRDQFEGCGDTNAVFKI